MNSTSRGSRFVSSAARSPGRSSTGPEVCRRFEVTRQRVRHDRVVGVVLAGRQLINTFKRQGLVAQGRTIQETIEIARDVVKKLLESQEEGMGGSPLPTAARDVFDYPLVVSA